MSKGIDIPIDDLVTKFESNLWTGNNNVFRGRIQRLESAEGNTTPQWFNPVSNRYEDVLLNKFVHCTSFFDVQPNEVYNSRFEATVWICFAVNLVKLYPSVTERATEYAHEDAIKAIKKYGKGFKITGIVRGLPAFAEYERVKQTDNMNEFYLFRVEASLKYPQNCN